MSEDNNDANKTERFSQNLEYLREVNRALKNKKGHTVVGSPPLSPLQRAIALSYAAEVVLKDGRGPAAEQLLSYVSQEPAIILGQANRFFRDMAKDERARYMHHVTPYLLELGVPVPNFDEAPAPAPAPAPLPAQTVLGSLALETSAPPPLLPLAMALAPAIDPASATAEPARGSSAAQPARAPIAPSSATQATGAGSDARPNPVQPNPINASQGAFPPLPDILQQYTCYPQVAAHVTCIWQHLAQKTVPEVQGMLQKLQESGAPGFAVLRGHGVVFERLPVHQQVFYLQVLQYVLMLTSGGHAAAAAANKHVPAAGAGVGVTIAASGSGKPSTAATPKAARPREENEGGKTGDNGTVGAGGVQEPSGKRPRLESERAPPPCPTHTTAQHGAEHGIFANPLAEKAQKRPVKLKASRKIHPALSGCIPSEFELEYRASRDKIKLQKGERYKLTITVGQGAEQRTLEMPAEGKWTVLELLSEVAKRVGGAFGNPAPLALFLGRRHPLIDWDPAVPLYEKVMLAEMLITPANASLKVAQVESTPMQDREESWEGGTDARAIPGRQIEPPAASDSEETETVTGPARGRGRTGTEEREDATSKGRGLGKLGAEKEAREVPEATGGRLRVESEAREGVGAREGGPVAVAEAPAGPVAPKPQAVAVEVGGCGLPQAQAEPQCQGKFKFKAQEPQCRHEEESEEVIIIEEGPERSESFSN